MKLNNIIKENCIEGMLKLPSNSVDIVVTSPPYNLDIKYNEYNDNKPKEEYLEWLNEVFKAVKHCLKDDGHFYLNVGYSNIDPFVGMDVAQVARKHFILQNNITWVKSISINDVTTGHFKPINSNRFSNPTWEHLFHFTKTGEVYCDKLSIGVPYMDDNNIDKESRMKGRMVKKLGYKNQHDFNKNSTKEEKDDLNIEVYNKLKDKPVNLKRCKGNTWFIPYDTINNRNKHRGSHPATFPIKLVEDCIKFSGLTSGVILDPFMGSGTTAIGGIKQGLDYIGFDIDQDYINFAEDRIKYEINSIKPKTDI
jgi:site-specific DNA-methyltransferase (adenine-specific)